MEKRRIGEDFKYVWRFIIKKYIMKLYIRFGSLAKFQTTI